MQWLLAVLIIFICGFLMLVVLLQRGRGGGLAGAFGGAGGTAAFGAKTGDVFTWITVVVAAVFLLVCVLANYAFDMSYAPATPQATSSEPLTAPEGATPVPTPGSEFMPFKVEPGEGGESSITITPIEMPPGAQPQTVPAKAPEGESKTGENGAVEPAKEPSKPDVQPPDEEGDAPAEEDQGPGRP